MRVGTGGEIRREKDWRNEREGGRIKILDSCLFSHSALTCQHATCETTVTTVTMTTMRMISKQI